MEIASIFLWSKRHAERGNLSLDVNATKRGVAPLVINLLLPLLGVTSVVCWELVADIVTNSSSSLKTFKANLLIVNLIYAHWRTRVRGETLNYVRFAFGWQQDK